MKQLREELEKAKKEVNEAFNLYVKKSTKRNYDEYLFFSRYYEGLKKAYELIEGE